MIENDDCACIFNESNDTGSEAIPFAVMIDHLFSVGFF